MAAVDTFLQCFPSEIYHWISFKLGGVVVNLVFWNSPQRSEMTFNMLISWDWEWGVREILTTPASYLKPWNQQDVDAFSLLQIHSKLWWLVVSWYAYAYIIIANADKYTHKYYLTAMFGCRVRQKYTNYINTTHTLSYKSRLVFIEEHNLNITSQF